MAYVSLGQQRRLPLRHTLPPPVITPIPRQMWTRMEQLRAGRPIPPGVVEHLQRLPSHMFHPTMYQRIQRLRPGQPLPVELSGLGDPGFFKKVFKSVGKVVKPLVKMVKPFLAPLVAMIPVVGIPAAAAIKAVQTIRASQKAQQAQQAVAADVQQAPSWATMTPAQQQAVIAAIMAGQIPSVQVPPDVSAAYQRAIQNQAAALPPPPVTVPQAAPAAAPAPMPWEAPGAPPAQEAGIMGGGMGTIIALGAAGLVVTMAMGGGGGRRR